MRKSEQTRALILETALTMFRDRGYEATTMRAVASQAGVSLGNAYYYFASKDHLIQAYYGRVHEQLSEAAGPILESERSFRRRMLGVLHAELDIIEPYHAFAGGLFRSAADPENPLSPFSAESAPVRKASTQLFATIVEGSTAKVDRALQAELPDLLWLYHMGIVLFWVHDRSASAQRTRAVVERTVPLVDRLIKLARLPGLGPVTRDLLSLVRDLRAESSEL